MWDGLAKVAEKYLKKGSLIYVEGKLKTEEWEKDGIKRYTTRIRVNTMNMLDKAAGEVNQNSATSSSEPSAAPIEPPTKSKSDAIAVIFIL